MSNKPKANFMSLTPVDPAEFTPDITPSDIKPDVKPAEVESGTVKAEIVPDTKKSSAETGTTHSSVIPDAKRYRELSPFRYFCQTVLPTVFDDSLSYYELLNKLVAFLNNVVNTVNETGESFNGVLDSFTELQNNVNNNLDSIDTAFENLQNSVNENVDKVNDAFGELQNTVNDNTEAVKTAFQSLQDKMNKNDNVLLTGFENLQNHVNTSFDTLIDVYTQLEEYVNTYFDSLDVQEEINNKLDEMVEDGTLANIFRVFINESPIIQNEVDNYLSAHYNSEVSPPIAQEPGVGEMVVISQKAITDRAVIAKGFVTVDLNTLIKPGVYGCLIPSSGWEENHFPENRNKTVTVISTFPTSSKPDVNLIGIQICSDPVASNSDIFVRSFNGGEIPTKFSKWSKLIGDSSRYVKIAIFGDSWGLVNGTGYINQLNALNYNIVDITIGGTGFAAILTSKNHYITRLNKVTDDVQGIIVNGTFNDIYRNPDIPVGDSSNILENTIVYYIDEFFNALTTKCPNIPIVCLMASNFKNENVTVKKCQEYIENLENICKKYYIKFINYSTVSTLKPWIESNYKLYYYNDTFHPNAKGMRIITNLLIKIIDYSI